MGVLSFEKTLILVPTLSARWLTVWRHGGVGRAEAEVAGLGQTRARARSKTQLGRFPTLALVTKPVLQLPGYKQLGRLGP